MKIHFLNGDNSGRMHELSESEATGIGRETDNKIQLLVGGVSRYHASIAYMDGKWVLRDLGSTNGTKHNGQVIGSPTQLKEGDVFIIGDQVFRFGDAVSETDVLSRPEILPAASGAASDAVNPPHAPAFVFRPLGGSSSEPSPIPGIAPSATPGPVVPENVVPPAPGLDFSAPKDAPSISFDNIFGKKTGAGSATAASGSSPSGNKKGMSNLLFYTLVLGVAVICVALFLSLNKPKQKPDTDVPLGRTVISNPFTLVYEKEIVAPDSIFRFRMVVEDNVAEVTLDDLKYNSRHFNKRRPLQSKQSLDTLKSAITATEFFTLTQGPLAGTASNKQEVRRLIVGYDENFNDITVSGNVVSSFLNVEKAVENLLAEEYGIVLSETVDEILTRANKIFEIAEHEFKTWEVHPENLRKAINNYRITEDIFEQFEHPRPPQWEIARKNRAAAEAQLETIRREGEQNLNIYLRQKEYTKFIEECARLMPYFDQDSERYQKIKGNKIKIEQLMKGS